jgi:hypothetical protein
MSGPPCQAGQAGQAGRAGRASMLAWRLALVRAVGVAAVAAWQPGVPGLSVHGRVDSAWAVGGVVFVVAIHSACVYVVLRLSASRCVFLHSRCFRPRLRFSHSPSLPSLPACRLPPAALAVLSPFTGRWGLSVPPLARVSALPWKWTTETVRRRVA